MQQKKLEVKDRIEITACCAVPMVTASLATVLVSAAWRGYPQVVPPTNCACGAELGREILRLRSQWHLRADSTVPPTVMLYGFPHSMTLATTNLGAHSGYDKPDNRSQPNPATASSLSSLSRVLQAQQDADSATMWCPNAASVLGSPFDEDAARLPLTRHTLFRCPPALRRRKVCHTVLMEEMRLAMLDEQAAVHGEQQQRGKARRRRNTTSLDVPHALFVETDMLWLQHPAVIFVRSSHWGQSCDLILTMHRPAVAQGNLNSGIMLMRKYAPASNPPLSPECTA